MKARLHIVTGKGGTGKTTAAAALAIALAGTGQRTLLVEVEGRQGIAGLFDLPPLPYEERRVALTTGGGEVYALALDVEEALLEYLDLFYGMRRAGWAPRRVGTLDFATTIAPGVRDILTTGKIKELVERAGPDRREYGAVVVDAPPTGRITQFLTVTGEVAGLAKVGPIRSQSDSVIRLVRSPRTAIHVVTILEEMPVQETADAVGELRRAGLRVGAVLINLARPALIPERLLAEAALGGLDRQRISSGLSAQRLPPEATEGLISETATHALRILAERELADGLAALGQPILELPHLSAGMDATGLYQLADRIRSQGMELLDPPSVGKHSNG